MHLDIFVAYDIRKFTPRDPFWWRWRNLTRLLCPRNIRTSKCNIESSGLPQSGCKKTKCYAEQYPQATRSPSSDWIFPQRHVTEARLPPRLHWKSDAVVPFHLPSVIYRVTTLHPQLETIVVTVATQHQCTLISTICIQMGFWVA